MAKKKPTRGKLVRKLDTTFSLYIRLRYAENEIVKCFTCGKKAHYKDSMQCGHFQSRRHYSTRWDEINCQVQCSSCNVFKHGEQFIFGQRLNEKYGEGTAKKLQQKSKQILKLSTADIIILTNKYKDLINIKK
tara:strand:- start:1049 stop:1447 length:399 start_codon:yes stop_codon:yes gene_type:complete